MSWQEAVTIAGMTLVTFGVRYPVLALMSRVPLSESFRAGLRYVPPAVLAAIIAPALFVGDSGDIWIAPQNSYLVAGLVAVAVAIATRRVLPTMAVGMAFLWAWRLVIPHLF